MECGSAREAISAALDDELRTHEARRLEDHLRRCPACRRWREQAYGLTRRMRLSVVTDPPAPDLGLMAAATAARYERRRSLPPGLARAGLVALALGQVAITIPALVLGTDHDAPIHVAHEMGSFELAIAAGFLVAAWRPQRAKGMRTLIGVAAMLLLITAVLDLAAGRTTLLDEAPHLLTFVGWVLLEALSRRTPDERGYPGRALWARPIRAAALRPAVEAESDRETVEELLEPPGRIARRAGQG